jgi:hypothetical protein
MICIPLDLMEEAGVTEQWMMDAALEMMSKLCTSTLRNLKDFLLDLDHPTVKAEITKAVAMQSKRDESASSSSAPPKKAFLWPERHAQAFEHKGADWWQASYPSPDIMQAHPGLNRLTDRMFDMAKLMGIAFPDRRLEGWKGDLEQRGGRVFGFL